MDFYDIGFGYDGRKKRYGDPGVEFPDSGACAPPFVDATGSTVDEFESYVFDK